MLVGDYEFHLTLAPVQDPALVQRLAARHGLKYSHIVLDAGASPHQPMLSWRGRASLDDVIARAQAHADRLRAARQPVVRIKVEGAPTNADVPTTDAQTADAAVADGPAPWRYFEHHIKVLLDDESDLLELAATVEPHDARLSRNARRRRSDGKHERFVTQRCWRVGRPAARRRLDDLLAAFVAWKVLEVEEEYAVYDDKLALDQGWLEEANHVG